LIAFKPASGFIIGIVGGVIDLASGTSLLLNGTQTGPMGETTLTPQNEAVALGLYVLGIIVIASAAMLIVAAGRRHSNFLSGLMVVYGIVMLLIGGAMAGGLISMMNTSLYGYAMLVIGLLMILSGSLMSRTKMSTQDSTSMPSNRIQRRTLANQIPLVPGFGSPIRNLT
jgi:hypothetical protein